jgi:hypothetical protein
MRWALLAIVVTGLLGAATLPAGAQGEFPLKYTEAQASDPLLMLVSSPLLPSPEKPDGLKALPKNLAGPPAYFSIPLGGRQVLAVADGSKPPRLYVDVAGTGDLSATLPVPRSGPEEGMGVYGPVALTVSGSQGRAGVKVWLQMLTSARPMFVSPTGYMMGEVKLAGQVYRVAAVSNGCDGRYDRVIQLPLSRSNPRQFDILAIDLNQEGEFDTDFATSVEVMSLPKMVRVKEAYYSIAMAPDGSSVRMAKIEPTMGTLDVGTADVEMVLLSEAGLLRFSSSGGKWQAPAGHYMTVRTQLLKTDAEGAKWMLLGSGSGKMEGFEIRAGETRALRLGPPLKTRIETRAIGDGSISISLALEGQTGEQYAPRAVKGGEMPQPPKLKILDEAGKILAQGNFEYG